jgi:hypothetical protein
VIAAPVSALLSDLGGEPMSASRVVGVAGAGA